MLDDADDKRDISLGIVSIARQMKRRFDVSVEKIGVTSAKWTLIAVVSRNPGATQRTIAEILEVTEASAGRLIDRLCADGYLRRSANPQDRRAYRVYLTERATPLLERLEILGRRNEEAAFAGFSSADLALFHEFLARMAANLSEAGPLSPYVAADEPAREPEEA